MYSHHTNALMKTQSKAEIEAARPLAPTTKAPTTKVKKKNDNDLDMAEKQAIRAAAAASAAACTAPASDVAAKGEPDGVGQVLAADANTPRGCEQEFIAAATFTTSKPGYVFKKGVKGLGYYKDARAACNNAQAAHNGAAKLLRSLEEWDELQAVDGRTYYYNKSSLITQWEVPR
jgi:hypothetical protein